MSNFRIALVAEGSTDAIVIEAALKALLVYPFVLTQLQPEPTRSRLGNGWGGVLRWCRDFAARGYPRIEDDPTLPGFDMFIIHLDADVANFSYANVGAEFEMLADQLGWPPLPRAFRCPPCDGCVEVARDCLLSWMGLLTLGPNTILCVPSKAIDAWLAAAVLSPGHRLLNNIECNLNLEGALANLPVNERIKKSLRVYRARDTQITIAWGNVRESCSQAERFSNDVMAALPPTASGPGNS